MKRKKTYGRKMFVLLIINIFVAAIIAGYGFYMAVVYHLKDLGILAIIVAAMFLALYAMMMYFVLNNVYEFEISGDRVTFIKCFKSVEVELADCAQVKNNSNNICFCCKNPDKKFYIYKFLNRTMDYYRINTYSFKFSKFI